MANGSVGEVVKLCGKLGIIGFGGPASHIAMLEDEAVARRKWLSREHFLDLVGATNLIPGPNSTEMMIHIGYQRAGWPGLIAAGISFVLPAVLLSTLIAWIYVEFGALPAVQPFLAGVKPAVLAVILGALWRLGQTASKPKEASHTRIALAIIGIAVAVAVYLGAPVIWSLIAGGLLGMLALRAMSGWSGAAALLALPESRDALPWADLSPASALKWAALLAAAAVPALTLGALGLFFLKVGSVLYGSGYVLVAFLEGDLVHEYGWLTQQQLLDAIAIGQFTPGPVLSTAAFIGYVLAGIPGAAHQRRRHLRALIRLRRHPQPNRAPPAPLCMDGRLPRRRQRQRRRPHGRSPRPPDRRHSHSLACSSDRPARRSRGAPLARHLRLGRHRRRPARLAAHAARLRGS